MPFCAFCQKEVVCQEKVGRTEVCLHCDADLHCCYQCQFYDQKSHHECREPQAEYVSEKDKANFCDYFAFDPQSKVQTAPKDALKTRWEDLFKKK